MSDIKSKLIAAGVRNLKEFGYPDVTPENIMTDLIYSGFFAAMLRDNLGNGFDDPINELAAQIKERAK